MDLYSIHVKLTKYNEDKYRVTKLFLIIMAILTELILFSFFIKVAFQFPFIFVNMAKLNPSSFNSILILVVGTLSTILAIVFALSQFIISNIVDKYSVQMIEKYEKSPKIAIFRINILIISFAFFLLVAPNLIRQLPLFYILGIILSTYSFIISFVFLIDFIEYMFTIINPSKFADTQKKDIIKAIINRNEKDANLGIIAMGDITIKLMRKGEEKVGLKYINYFKDIFMEFMDLRQGNPEKYKIEVFRIYENKDNKNNVLEYIINEYLRIYKEALLKKQDIISKKVSDNLFQILNVIMYDK